MKRFITLVIAFAMLITSLSVSANGITLNLNDNTVAQATEKQAIFSDTSINAWYYPHMEMLIQKGGINGYADGTFKPDNIITNAEFVKIIVGLVGGDVSASDVHWADGYIQKAKSVGIVDADELPVTDYDEPIRRQTMAKYAARTMNKVLGETPTENTSEYTAEIKDWSDVCEACKPYVAEVYSKGVICGMPDGTFSGANYTTRAESTTMLVRMIDESYRVKMYSGVAFNDTTDVLADGKMTVEKSTNFMDITLESLKFYKENGKYYVSGTFPELPDGFENWLTIDIERNDDQPVISFTTGFTMIEEQKISPNGTFVREISIPSPDKINYIHIKIGVEATDNLKTNSKSAYYNILSNKQNEVTCIVSDSSETNKKIQYDFSKLFAW